MPPVMLRFRHHLKARNIVNNWPSVRSLVEKYGSLPAA
jgi:hypothetical protein